MGSKRNSTGKCGKALGYSTLVIRGVGVGWIGILRLMYIHCHV